MPLSGMLHLQTLSFDRMIEIKFNGYCANKLGSLKALKGLIALSWPALAAFMTFCIQAGNCIVVCELCELKFQSVCVL